MVAELFFVHTLHMMQENLQRRNLISEGICKDAIHDIIVLL